jgi:hypothetical protein
MREDEAANGGLALPDSFADHGHARLPFYKVSRHVYAYADAAAKEI